MTVVRNGVQGACLKSRNLRANPRVSVSIWDNEDPNRYLEVEGNASLGEKCAGEHINDLSLKYEGIDFGTPDKSRDRTREAERVLDHTSPSRAPPPYVLTAQ
jgi:hypothetical protein